MKQLLTVLAAFVWLTLGLPSQALAASAGCIYGECDISTTTSVELIVATNRAMVYDKQHNPVFLSEPCKKGDEQYLLVELNQDKPFESVFAMQKAFSYVIPHKTNGVASIELLNGIEGFKSTIANKIAKSGQSIVDIDGFGAFSDSVHQWKRSSQFKYGSKHVVVVIDPPYGHVTPGSILPMHLPTRIYRHDKEMEKASVYFAEQALNACGEAAHGRKNVHIKEVSLGAALVSDALHNIYLREAGYKTDVTLEQFGRIDLISSDSSCWDFINNCLEGIDALVPAGQRFIRNSPGRDHVIGRSSKYNGEDRLGQDYIPFQGWTYYDYEHLDRGPGHTGATYVPTYQDEHQGKLPDGLTTDFIRRDGDCIEYDVVKARRQGQHN